ncbi:MAG: sigma-70 family RNA polymerase sigma factor [Mariniblastus sp.]|nr:sigma-70 family RNA polymerase sigma factor [Mariniblastus sp.]
MNEEIRPAVPEGSEGDDGASHQWTQDWIKNAIDEHEASLLRYANHFVHDLETARDIVQDTFLQLCRHPNEELRPRLAQWLFTVCRNRAIDVCRKERRMKLAPENQLTDHLDAQSDESVNPAARLESSETAAGLLQQVGRLPDRQQEVLRLKFNVGLSYKEIAEVTGLSSTNVGFILHTAISKLRQRLVQQ